MRFSRAGAAPVLARRGAPARGASPGSWIEAARTVIAGQ
jgi:hypothetical protein